MATFGHLAAGAVCGAICSRATGTSPVPTVAAFAALAGAPDLDLFLVPLDPWETPFAHRTLTHSLPTAVAVGALVRYFVREYRRPGLVAMLAVMALASHGLLDALTRAGEAPRLLWPFTSTRFGFAWQPLPGMPSFQEYFTFAAAPVYAQELVLLLPLIVATPIILWWKHEPAG